MINITLDEEQNMLEVAFQYDPELLDIVRSLPIRTWNPKKKTWLVPPYLLQNLLSVFSAYDPKLDKKVLALSQNKVSVDALTVSELNTRISTSLKKAFPAPFWIVGEIMDYKKSSNNSKHKFFKLIEKKPNTQSTLAEVGITIWENNYVQLEKKLSSYPKPFELVDGIEVRLLVELSFHIKSNSITLKVIDIDPVYTIGKLAESREKILAELENMGLTKKNSSLPLIPFANKIAVIASISSDGYNDFATEIVNSHMDISLHVYNVTVQGEKLSKTIISALEYFKERKDLFDYVIIIRGGGSSTDLIGFDNKDLAIAVANCPIKVICGIGHERDKTVIDYLTLSLKTPTKTATFLVEALDQDYIRMEKSFERMINFVSKEIEHQRNLIHSQQIILLSEVNNITGTQKTLITGCQKLIHSNINFIFKSQRSHLHSTFEKLAQSTSTVINNHNNYLDKLLITMSSYNPINILKKGYSYITSKSGNLVKRASELPLEEIATINFIDGNWKIKPLKKTILSKKMQEE